MTISRCDNCGGRRDRPGLFLCRQGHPAPDLAQRIIAALEDDFRDRRGLRQQWERIDDDTQDKIRDRWAALVRRELEREL